MVLERIIAQVIIIFVAIVLAEIIFGNKTGEPNSIRIPIGFLVLVVGIIGSVLIWFL